MSCPGSAITRWVTRSLEFQDPVTAAKYADKALALMRSALQDHQKFGEYAQQYIARGNGSTKVFTLPNTNIVASSLKVFKAPISVIPVTRDTTTNRTDTVDSYLTYIKVSNTSDGPPITWKGRTGGTAVICPIT